ATELWTPLDEAKLSNLDGLLDQFVHRYPDGRLAGVGAVAWYITLVSNTDVIAEALQTGEIPMGQYYHDVAGLAAADGFPVRSTFPKEGGVNDSGSWAVSKASGKAEQAHVFIDYMCQPAVQAALSRNVGTAPTLRRELLDLSDAEFAAVASEIPPIIPNYRMYLERGDWLEQKWIETITG
ncbi:unnamed protein product, partial [Symbiodinium necroappetens]